MKIGGYQILDLYNYTFTIGTATKVEGAYKLIKAMRGKPINTSRIRIGSVTYDAVYLAFIPDGTSFKATFGDKTITITANDNITFTNGIIGGGGGTQVQANWNETDTESPSYIQNKPTIPAAQVQSDWEEDDAEDPSYIQNKPTIPAAQVQSDWEEDDTEDPSYIQNKPTIPTIPSGLPDFYNPINMDRIPNVTLPASGQTTYFAPTTGEVRSTVADKLRTMSQGDTLITRNFILEAGGATFYFGVTAINCIGTREYEIAGSAIGIEPGTSTSGYAICLNTEFSIAATGAVITFGAGNSYITNLS